MQSATQISIVGSGASAAASLLKKITEGVDFPLTFSDDGHQKTSDFVVNCGNHNADERATIVLVAGNLDGNETEKIKERITDGGILIFSDQDEYLQNLHFQHFIRKITYNTQDVSVSGSHAALQTSYGKIMLETAKFEDINAIPAVLKLCGQLLISEEKIAEFLAEV